MGEHCVEMSLKSKIRHEGAHLCAAAAGREDCAKGARIELQQRGSAKHSNGWKDAVLMVGAPGSRKNNNQKTHEYLSQRLGNGEVGPWCGSKRIAKLRGAECSAAGCRQQFRLLPLLAQFIICRCPCGESLTT